MERENGKRERKREAMGRDRENGKIKRDIRKRKKERENGKETQRKSESDDYSARAG